MYYKKNNNYIMINTNYRSVNGYQAFEGNLILSSITNSILSTDPTGLIYGVTSNPSNFFKDNGSGSYTFSQITSDDVQFKLNSNIVPVTDSTGTVLTNSNVSTTQVNYLSNVTSDVQAQLNNTQPLLAAANKLDKLM